MKGTGIIITIIALVLLGSVAYLATRSTTAPVLPGIPTPTIEIGKDVQKFTIIGTPFKFTPNEIAVKKGDTVQIEFKNDQGFHDLTIEGYNINTKRLQVNESDMIQFVADKSGEFKFFCSVPTHADQGMVGKLIVKE